MNLPEKTSAIFERLSKGKFICSNSTDQITCRLYDIIDENEDILYEYFSIIDFELERGNEYFYFSRIEPKADIQNKIEKAEKWIDLIDFLKTYDYSFTSGYRFHPIDIELKTRVDLNLREKLDTLKRYFTGDPKSYNEKINLLLKILEKDGLIELENAISNQYKVVAAFGYIEQLIMSINTPEDKEYEVSE